jgi:hypothetical protein
VSAFVLQRGVPRGAEPDLDDVVARPEHLVDPPPVPQVLVAGVADHGAVHDDLGDGVEAVGDQVGAGAGHG